MNWKNRAALWFVYAMAHMPLRAVHAVGAAIGLVLALLPTRMKRVSQINLQACMPELDAHARRDLVRRSLIETGKTIAEAGPLWLWPSQRVLGQITDVAGDEAFRAAIAEGRGVILAAPHLGAWELTGLYCSTLTSMTSLYQPPQLTALSRVMRAGREKLGAHLVATDSRGIRALYQALAAGQMIGILPDQEPNRGNGVFVPFFGIPANTMILLPRLAAKSGAPVFFAFAERLPRARGYKMHIRRAEPPVADADPLTAAAALNREVEKCVRQLPAQYQWSYKRFKSRPAGSPKLY